MLKRFKDKNPIETIEIIRKNLNKVGIELEEDWEEPIEGIHYVMVYCNGTSLRANGKGSTKEYALASAYGEFIERIQNLLPFRLSGYDFIKNNKYFSNDKFKCELAKEDKEYWVNLIKTKRNKFNFSGSMFGNLDRYNLYSCFVDMNTNQNCYIPYKALDILYGSNGMASGNTIEEAIVQALSEVIERHVVKESLRCDNFNIFYDMTEYVLGLGDFFIKSSLELKKSGWKLFFIDFSLGGRFPVIGALIINDKLEYFVNLGAHPSLEVASERALTELLQGRDVITFTGLSKLFTNDNVCMKESNLLSIFRDGSGNYPIKVFKLEEMDRIPDIWSNKYICNEDMMNSLLTQFKDSGFSVLLKESNFLGNPAVHVVIPGFSEIDNLENFSLFRKGYISSSLLNFWGEIGTEAFNIEKADFIVENYPVNECKTLDDFFNLPIPNTQDNPLIDYSSNLVIAVFLVYQKRYSEAIEYLENYLQEVAQSDVALRYPCNEFEDIINYYRSIIVALKLYNAGLNENEVLQSLKKLGIENAIEVVNDISEENVLLNLPRVSDGLVYLGTEIVSEYNKEIEIFSNILCVIQTNNDLENGNIFNG